MIGSSSSTSLRRVLWLLAPVAVFAAVIARTAELSSLLAVFTSAAPLWLLVASALAMLFAVNQGAMYRGVFGVLGVEVPLRDAVILSLVMAFASLALPAGTASGIAYFVSAARDRGISGSRALLAGLAYYLFDYSALTPALLIGMVVLRLHHDLGPGSLVALAVFYVAALMAAAVVAWGLWHPERVASGVFSAGARLNDLIRWTRRSVRPEALAEFGREIQEILATVRQHPGRSARPLLHALLLQATSLALLAAVFAALEQPLAPAVLIAGYAVGTVFMVVSITPSGAGVVEAAMTVTFTSLGVPLEVAAAVTVLFRLYTFWLPMLAGFLTLRLLKPVHA